MISFVGYPPRAGCLRSNHTITFLFPMLVVLSHGGVFGGMKFPCDWRSLFGQSHYGRSSPWTI
jgi:hypothetical protein